MDSAGVARALTERGDEREQFVITINAHLCGRSAAEATPAQKAWGERLAGRVVEGARVESDWGQRRDTSAPPFDVTIEKVLRWLCRGA